MLKHLWEEAQQAGQQGPTEASGLLVDTRLGLLEEDVCGADLVLFQISGGGSEGEEAPPMAVITLGGDEEAGPALPLTLQECHGPSAGPGGQNRSRRNGGHCSEDVARMRPGARRSSPAVEPPRALEIAPRTAIVAMSVNK